MKRCALVLLCLSLWFSSCSGAAPAPTTGAEHSDIIASDSIENSEPDDGSDDNIKTIGTDAQLPMLYESCS